MGARDWGMGAVLQAEEQHPANLEARKRLADSANWKRFHEAGVGRGGPQGVGQRGWAGKLGQSEQVAKPESALCPAGSGPIFLLKCLRPHDQMGIFLCFFCISFYKLLNTVSSPCMDLKTQVLSVARCPKKDSICKFFFLSIRLKEAR